MNLEKSMDELERHINSSQSYFDDVRVQIERELQDINEEIADLKDEISKLEEQNILLEERLEDSQELVSNMQKENAMLQLELTEVTNELIALRSDNMTKAGIILHLKHELVIFGKNI
jgi:predicted  nucleic acid-binding Zn-ribbon protein